MQRTQNPRIDLVELKVHIVKKIGVERCRRYFYYLGRFLSQKLTKSEFDKSCCHLLGRENISLHNKLVRSILRNASLAKSPPQVQKIGHGEKSLVLGKEDGSEQLGSLIPNHNRNDSVWSSNGELHKVKSGTCDGTIRDRPSPLGPNGKFESLLHQPLSREDNGGGAFLCPAEKMRVPDRCQVAAPLGRADEVQEERGRLILSTCPVTAPLGIPSCSTSRIPSCPTSVGGTRRTVPVSTSSGVISCYDSGGLLDTDTITKRMENIAVAQGLGGVSAECSGILNNMLDIYLKKLIKSCVGLGGARCTNGSFRKESLVKLQSQDEIVNWVRPSDSLQIQTSNQPINIMQEQRSLSLLDFRVAMELNPHHLSEDWPLLRERISMRSFEEREGV